MKNLIIDIATMNRVCEVVRPLISGDNYMSLAIGTGIRKGQGNVADAMMSKVSITNGTEQAELVIVTAAPDEVPEGISAINPAENVVVPASDFVAVVEALGAYEHQFSVDIDAEKIMISAGEAYMPVYRVDASKMKALVPHKLNSTAVELFDEDIINIRVLGKELLEAVKASSSLSKSKKILSEANYAFYNVSIRDSEVVMQDVEVNGVKKSVARYNGQMQIACTDSCAFSAGTCNVLSIKGMAGEQLKRLPDQSILEGKTSPVISFKKEDGKVSAVATSYADFKEEWDKARELDVAENDFQFGIPLAGMEKLLKLVSTVPDSYVELTIGKRYVYAFLTGLQCIYMCPQTPLKKISFTKMYRDTVAAFLKKNCNVTVDSKDISNAIRIMNLYEKDALKGQMPCELVVTDKGIEVKRNEARAMLGAVSSNTSIELVEYGIHVDYLSCAVNTLPAGNIQFGYGMEKPVFLFTKGGEAPNPYGAGMVVCGIPDVAGTKQQVAEAYQKSLEKKKEKESKK